ncbi:unnamed protein product [Caenorhabditis angaria]|uniref:K Homology domain-containing protein n=1 Tax=Caenorhabditis angaria TaxID=860376 RepID=A0A9P1MT21_9PELO|nr:unnamed protein product [Caenorhabditis angaria]
MASQILTFKITDFLDISLMGKFIGEKGCNITKIEKENDVCLDILGEMLKITGQYWNIKQALLDVRSLLTAIRNENNRFSTKIPSKYVGFIIGKNGAKINEIKTTANVNIEIDKENETDYIPIVIVGNYNQILTAVRLIRDHLSSFGKHKRGKQQILEEVEEIW